MKKTTIICFQSSLGKILRHLLTAYGFKCSNDIQLDTVVSDSSSVQTNGDTGMFFVWADDFYQKGTVDAVSWFTRLRIAEKYKWHNWPVIILGYDSYPTFLRHFKAPRILASPGIEYIQLPCSIRTLKETVDKIVSPSEAVIRDYIQDHDHARRLGDRLTHDIGNFYAIFRLLQGAYLNESLTEDDYFNVCLHVDEIHQKTLSDHLSYEEYSYLRGGRLNNLEPSNKPTKSQPLAEGKKILLIDDAASLGWARVLASLFTGNADLPRETEQQGIKTLRQSDFLALGRINPLDQIGENTFFLALSNFIDNSGKDFISGKDLILLDLRLRRNEDEEVPFEQCSGVEILKKIRRFNAGVPVIIFTASRKAGSVEVVKQWGANDYFIKDPGSIGEHPDDIKAYYQDFERKVENALMKAYERNIWIGIEEYRVNEEVAGFFKQAFALIRQQPSKFEQELSYTPYAATVVALGNAIEKYVGCGPKEEYEKAVDRFYNDKEENDLKNFARYLGFLRNKAAHPQSAMVISESDARIAFTLALWSIRECKKSKAQAQCILGVIIPENTDIIARKIFSYLRKKINSKTPIPKFKKLYDINDICKSVCNSEISISYMSFLMKMLFGFIGDKGYEKILLTKIMHRFSETESVSENVFKPQYENSEMNFPCIREAFWSDSSSKWVIPGVGVREIEKKYVFQTKFKEKYCGHTQSFLFQSADDFEAWGPPIPFGEYPEDELRKMLTIAS